MLPVMTSPHAQGSSPLARGTPHHGASRRSLPGLIPARAGNTERGFVLDLVCGAHPRSRGEHITFAIWGGVRLGSSPLARGTRDTITLNAGRWGLIPARAGNTWLQNLRRRFLGAHPRSRGEHPFCVHHDAHLLGSSPLARGTRACPDLRAGRAGLIPARAGNTKQGMQANIIMGAHPRSRGEHASVYSASAA